MMNKYQQATSEKDYDKPLKKTNSSIGQNKAKKIELDIIYNCEEKY